MSLPDDDLRRAETDAADSRRRLADTVAALQTRLKPGALVHDAVGGLKDMGSGVARSGVAIVRRHPLPTIGVIAAVTALIARKPLRRLLRRK